MHVNPQIRCLYLRCWAKRRVHAPQHVLFLHVLSDLSLPHQVFIAKTDIWNGEIHRAAWFHSEKVSEEGSAAGPGERGETTSLGLEIDPPHLLRVVPSGLGPSPPLG